MKLLDTLFKFLGGPEKTELQNKLKELGVPKEIIKWIGQNSLTVAWNKCSREDWMLLIYKKLYPDNLKELTLAKAHCANTLRDFMQDERSKKAVDVAMAFGEGKATREDLDDAHADALLAAIHVAEAAALVANDNVRAPLDTLDALLTATHVAAGYGGAASTRAFLASLASLAATRAAFATDADSDATAADAALAAARAAADVAHKTAHDRRAWAILEINQEDTLSACDKYLFLQEKGNSK